MGNNYRAVLLTVLTISVFTIAIIELTGISRTAIFRPYKGANQVSSATVLPQKPKNEREQQVAVMQKTSIQFYESKFNFGKHKEGEILKHTFKFKNNGPNPLMIAKASVSCGCTVPTFPKEPIPPNAEGELVVEFNSEGREGFQQKNIIVHSNAVPDAVPISIEAEIY